MNAPEERSLGSYPRGELESPFLEDKLFVEESEARWGANLAELQSESPFTRAFQEKPGVDFEPEPYVQQFDEESEVLGVESFPEQVVEPQEEEFGELEEVQEQLYTDEALREEQYESTETELRPELFIQRSEPSGEEEDSAETEYVYDVLETFQGDNILEQLTPSSAPSPGIADALRNSDWPRAVKLAIAEGWRDENKLTNLIFFARHSELAGGKLDPQHPKFKQLSSEWITIRDREVWPVIEKSAGNAALTVAGRDVAAYHRQFWGQSGKRFRDLVEQAAKRVDLNPGLLAATLLTETGTRNDYLTTDKVSSYRIGVDDFYDRRHAIAQRVPAYAQIGWDRKQEPVEHPNDAKKPRLVRTIQFNSGPDGLLASAVYLKYGEVRLREEAARLGGNFDKLPLETRWALIRMALNAGVGGATKRLTRALKGEDVLVRKNIPRKAYQTERNATIHTARALHLSEWIFSVSMRPTIQQEVESTETFSEEEGINRYEFEETGAEGTTLRGERFSELRNVSVQAEEELLEEAYAEEEQEAFPEDVTSLEEPLIPEDVLRELEDEKPAPAPDLRKRIVEIAKQEWNNWKQGNLSETASGAKPLLLKYWMNFRPAGFSEKNANIAIQEEYAWSAVFISYVMREAGAGNAFSYDVYHTTYIAAAKKTAENRDSSMFRAYDISSVRPEVGDLVCRDRSRKPGAPCAGTNFGNVKSGRISHSDIVVDVKPEHIVILGGNTAQTYPHRGMKGNTVGQRKIRLDKQGFVIREQWKGACRYFAVMKPPGAEAAVPSVPTGTPVARPTPGEANPPAELIRFAQRVLNATEDERLAADGIPGPRTSGALERFRRKYNLGAGGVLDDKTRLALAQRALEGLALQSMFEIGKRDIVTDQALSNFKTQRGLGPEPTLDAATRVTLADALERRVDPR